MLVRFDKIQLFSWNRFPLTEKIKTKSLTLLQYSSQMFQLKLMKFF
jgi:hypothetical protein